MNCSLNICIFLTLILALNALPYNKRSNIIPIPIEETDSNDEKIVGIPTIKGLIKI